MHATLFPAFLVTTCLLALSPLNADANQETVLIPQQVLNSIHKHISTNSWIGIYYDVVPKVLKDHDYKTFVEVGVALGGHADTILKTTQITNYYGIDPYLYNFDPKDGFSQEVGNYSKLGGQKNFDYLYEWVKNVRLEPYKDRCQIIRDTSVNAASLFEDESLDCIFIDGDHRYEPVLQDLAAWFPKLRKGGLMVGDDYWMEPVSKAVNHFFSSKNKPVFFYTASSGYKIWAVYK